MATISVGLNDALVIDGKHYTITSVEENIGNAKVELVNTEKLNELCSNPQQEIRKEWRLRKNGYA